MKQIYNFEQHKPPVLNENMLRAELERRKLRWQTALIAVAAILTQIIIMFIGVSAIDFYPVLATVSIAYVIISSTGCGVLAVVCTRKGGIPLCE